MMNTQTDSGKNQALPVSVGAISEVGLREENQDNMTGFASPLGSVYLIADGMGGYRGGAEAARVVSETFRTYLMAAAPDENYWDALARTARDINETLMTRNSSGEEQFAGMGSTVVIALIRPSHDGGLELITAHAGDSRVYVMRDGVLNIITKDHTRVQWLIDNQVLDEASARSHPEASVLTRAFGHTTALSLDISQPMPLLDGDCVLLCSDGLSGFASTDDINGVIAQYPDPSECVHQLVQLALARGSNDNITVQCIRIGAARARVHLPKRKRRETLPEGLAAIAAPDPPASTRSRRNIALFAFVAVALFALTGFAVYRFLTRPVDTQTVNKNPPADPVSKTSHDAAQAIDTAKKLEPVLSGKVARASASAKEQLSGELASLQAKRRQLERDLSDLKKAKDGTRSGALTKKVQTETGELSNITGRIQTESAAADTAGTSAKRNE